MPKKLPFALGDLIQTRVAKPMWYSDYGLYPDYTIETGTIGTVVSVGIAPVRGPRTTDMTKVQFGHIKLKDSDRWGGIYQSYFPEQIKKVDPMTPDVAEYMMARYSAFHFKCPICQTFKYAQFYKLYNAQGTVVDHLRNERSGRTYGLATVRYLYGCCGETLQARQVRGVYDQTVSCGRQCYESKSRDCTCSCAGLLHGCAHQFTEICNIP
jgi:hypothetical protein